MNQVLDERRQAPSGPIEAGGSFLFAALSRLRRARIFHPSGHAYSARLDLNEGAALWLPVAHLLDEPQRALVRVSRGGGLPDPLPDILGLAVRVPNLAPATGQDFLMASCGRTGLGRNLLKPAGDFLGTTYSTILPYKVAEKNVLVGARGSQDNPASGIRTLDAFALEVERRPLRFELLVAELRGEWQPVGTLSIDELLPDEVSERLAFNPWNTHPDLKPGGPLTGLRRGAYPGSQQGRAESLNEDRTF